MQVVPILGAIDGVQHVGPCTLLPRQLAALVQPAIRAVAQPTLRIGRRRIEMFDALHDVAVVTSDHDRPATFGRDLRTDPLAFDPLVPQVIGLAIRPDAIGDHVGMEVVGVLMRGQNVLALLHTDCLE
jgi:hypothetical protein